MSLLLRSLCVVACVLAVCSKSQGSLTIQSRIAGGTAASINQFPHQVSIRVKQPLGSIFQHTCGGSLISFTVVLTAGHCVCNENVILILNRLAGVLTPASTPIKSVTTMLCTALDPTRLRVVEGSIYLNSGGTAISVQRVIRNSNYNANTIDYDMALLELKTAATSTPIPLSGVTAIEKTFDVSGWGLTNGNGATLPNELQYAKVKQLPTDTCNKTISDAVSGAYVTPRMICTFPEPSSCPGDSGGALIANLKVIENEIETEILAQYGIVSWGISTGTSVCDNHFPNVFANVPEFCDFIFENAGVRCVS